MSQRRSEDGVGPITRKAKDPEQPYTEDVVMGYPDRVELPDVPPPDWATWETEYRETGCISFAVLAIGKWQDNPPRWAVEACRDEYRRHVGRPTGYASDNDKNLDQMALLLSTGEAKTVHAAAQCVCGNPGYNDSNVGRLIRLWREEEKNATVVDPDTGQVIHPRYERKAVRMNADRMAKKGREPGP